MRKLLFALLLIGTAQAQYIRTTAFTASVAETDSTPHLGYCKLGARNYRLPQNAIALSDDLRRRYPCGTRVILRTPRGNYAGIVADRIPGANKADILFGSRREALRLGVTKATIQKLR